MGHLSRSTPADDAYDQIMAVIGRALHRQGLEHLPEQTKRLILLQMITTTPDLIDQLSPALAKKLTTAAHTLLAELPPEHAAQVRQILSTLERPKGASR